MFSFFLFSCSTIYHNGIKKSKRPECFMMIFFRSILLMDIIFTFVVLLAVWGGEHMYVESSNRNKKARDVMKGGWKKEKHKNHRDGGWENKSH